VSVAAQVIRPNTVLSFALLFGKGSKEEEAVEDTVTVMTMTRRRL
jgi:hypothetical protein